MEPSLDAAERNDPLFAVVLALVDEFDRLAFENTGSVGEVEASTLPADVAFLVMPVEFHATIYAQSVCRAISERLRRSLWGAPTRLLLQHRPPTLTRGPLWVDSSTSPAGELDRVSLDRQLELFGRPGLVACRERHSMTPARDPRVRNRRPRSASMDPDVAARLLADHDDFRVLRRLRPRSATGPRSLAPGERIAIVVDTETTGLDHGRDEIIELGMVAFVHDDQGALVDVIDTFSALREPSIPISAAVTRLTGISAETVQGRVIDVDAVERFIDDADLVIAHNAGFDRPFCERLARGFSPKAWACSVKEVDWAGHGFEGTKLGYLIGQCGFFHQGHRAVDDCHALLQILAASLPEDAGPALRHLLAAAETTRVRLWAEAAPFDLKDVLKRRGYRWNDGADGRPRSWWAEVDEDAVEAEIRFLQREVYMREVWPRTQRVTAFERYRG